MRSGIFVRVFGNVSKSEPNVQWFNCTYCVFEHEVLTDGESFYFHIDLVNNSSLLLPTIDKIKPSLKKDRENFILPQLSIAKTIHRRWYVNDI
jgi:hypothetical protein